MPLPSSALPGALPDPAALTPSPPAALAALVAALEAADAAARDGGPDAAAEAFLRAVCDLGFGRVVLEARDARGERVAARAVGPGGRLPAPPPLAAGVWRRWLRLLEQGGPPRAAAPGGTGAAAGEEPAPPVAPGARWFDLAADAWARAEFGALWGDGPAEPEGPAAGGVLFVLTPEAADGVRAVLAAERPAPGPPPPDAVRAAVVLARGAAGRLDRARLAAVSDARAERLRLLHAAGVALARSLDAGAVAHELARQVARLVPHDGLVVAHPDLEAGTVRTALRLVRGLARPRADAPLGAGPIGEAARTGAPVRLDAYDPTRSPLAAADDVVGDAGPAGSVLAVPMRAGARLVGVLAVHADAPAAFGDDEVEVLRTVAAQAAVALANAEAFASSEAERRQSDALVALARAVGGSRRPNEVLRLGLRHTLALLGAEGAFVALRQPANAPADPPDPASGAPGGDGAHLHVVAGAGTAERLTGALLAVADTVPGRAAAGAGRAVLDNDVAAAGHAGFPLHDVAPVAQLAAVPLVTGAEVIGVLAAVNRPAPFGPDDARVLGRLGELLAVAAVNARLFASVEAATREWRVAFDATGEGMAVLDADGRVVRANRRAAELLADGPPDRRTPQALLGADFAARLCGGPRGARAAEAPGDAATLRALVAAGRRERARVRAAGPAPGAGRVFDVLVSPHPDGGCVATFDDVTARVALAERHRLLVETSRDALLITDRAGRVVYANPAAGALFGRGDALVGMRASDLVRPDEVDALLARVAGARLDAPLTYEFTAVRPDGSERVLAVSTAPLRELGDRGPASGVAAALRDVTDERRAARALAEREKLAALGQLVGGVAHELNNPLAGVLATSELLLGEPVFAEAAADGAAGAAAPDVVVDAETRRELRDLAAAVHREARRAARTVSRLLDFARQHAPRRAPTDVNRALGDALALRRSSLQLAGVHVRFAPDPALPPAWADAHELQQVFLNLLANAEYALAHHPGPRHLALRTRAFAREGAAWVAAEVADSGPGLTPAEATRVFEPFYTTKPEGEGTGLGLAVSLGIVREHGGALRAEGAPGEGATFVVELPAAPAESPGDAPAAAPPASAPAAAGGTA